MYGYQESRGPHRLWRRPRKMLAVLGAVAVMVSLVWSAHAASVLLSRPPQVSAATRMATMVAQTKVAKTKGPQNLCAPRLPWDTIRQQVALGLHLTVTQVRLRVLRGQPIQVIAAAQHLSLAQLHTLELHALQVGNERWIRLGCNTRQDGAAYMRIYSRMTLAQLNQEFTIIFVGA